MVKLENKTKVQLTVVKQKIVSKFGKINNKNAKTKNGKTMLKPKFALNC